MNNGNYSFVDGHAETNSIEPFQDFWIATRAWLVDMSYRGSCDTVEEVQVPTERSYVNNPLTETVKQARKLTDWSKPAKVIMLVEGQIPRNAHPGCPVNGHASFGPSECFRYSLDLAPLQNPLDIPAIKRTFGPTWKRHQSTTNYLFMGGHVERLLPHQAGEIANDWQKYLDDY